MTQDRRLVHAPLPTFRCEKDSRSSYWKERLADLHTAHGEPTDEALQFSVEEISVSHLHNLARSLKIKIRIQKVDANGTRLCWRVE